MALQSAVPDEVVPQCAVATAPYGGAAEQCAVSTAVAYAAQGQPSLAAEPAAQDVEQVLRAAAPQDLVSVVLVQMHLWPAVGKVQLTMCTDLFEP